MKKNNNFLIPVINFDVITIPSLQGRVSIKGATDVFANIDNGFTRKTSIPTAEIEACPYKLIANGSFMKIFASLSGHFDQKFLSENQIVECCKNLPELFFEEFNSAIFLARNNEDLAIDEVDPEENSVMIQVLKRFTNLEVFRFEYPEEFLRFRKCDKNIFFVPKLIKL